MIILLSVFMVNSYSYFKIAFLLTNWKIFMTYRKCKTQKNKLFLVLTLLWIDLFLYEMTISNQRISLFFTLGPSCEHCKSGLMVGFQMLHIETISNSTFFHQHCVKNIDLLFVRLKATKLSMEGGVIRKLHTQG